MMRFGSHFKDAQGSENIKLTFLLIIKVIKLKKKITVKKYKI